MWNYTDGMRDPPLEVFWTRRCIFCQETLHLWPIETVQLGPGTIVSDWDRPGIFPNTQQNCSYSWCSVCGWWTAFRSHWLWPDKYGRNFWYGFSAGLKELDLTDLAVPLAEVKRYLVAKYADRFRVHPQRFEEVVASVFTDWGYVARVTGFTHDGGIDIILDGPDGRIIGVQVKRYKNSISAEQIRAFTGALILGGYTQGIFVTTSGFQPGAVRAAARSATIGVPVRLVNADRLYHALRLERVAVPKGPEDWFTRQPKMKFLLGMCANGQ
jgi:restriction system protein